MTLARKETVARQTTVENFGPLTLAMKANQREVTVVGLKNSELVTLARKKIAENLR